MARERLDKHDKIHHELFDEDTNEVGSLGDLVEKHAGDAVFLTPAERSIGGADGGEADWEAEMSDTDPADGGDENPGDLYSARDEDTIFATDQTGTVEGIARGFGTHLPQDIGAGGFQVEEIPRKALKYQGRPVADGEELDDYDDEGDTGEFDSSPGLARASEPGANRVQRDPDDDGEPTPDRIPVKPSHPRTTDDQLDATRQITETNRSH